MSTIKESLTIVIDLYENNKRTYETFELDLFTVEGIDRLDDYLNVLRKLDGDIKLDLIFVNSSRPELKAYLEHQWKIKETYDFTDFEFIELLHWEFMGYCKYPETNKSDLGALIALASLPTVLNLDEIFDLISNQEYSFIKEWSGTRSLVDIGEELAIENDFYYALEENNVLEFFEFGSYAHRELKCYIHVKGYGYYKFEDDVYPNT